MKMIIKTVLLSLLEIIFAANIVTAQEVAISANKPKPAREGISEEQLALVKANRSKQIEFRNAFRETLTGNQLDILTDPGLKKEEKLRAFRQSLSDNQVKMMNSNKKQFRAQKNTLRTTFSNQQRSQIRRMAVNRSQQNKVIFRRARMPKRSI